MNSISRIENLGGSGMIAHEFDPRWLLRTLWRHRLLITAVAALALGSAWFIVGQMTPIYSSTTKVMIDSRPGRFLDSRDSEGDVGTVDAQVLSEVEVMSSRNIARRVADKLDLYADPRFTDGPPAPAHGRLLETVGLLAAEIARAVSAPPPPDTTTKEEREHRRREAVVDAVLGGLVVVPVEQSLVIRIQMISPDPVMAARLADAYAEAYIEEQLESKFQAVRYISTWLNGRLEALRRAVVQSEQAVATYRAANALVDTTGPSTHQQRLSELTSQLMAAQAKRAETEARLAHVEAALSGPRGAVAIEDLPESTLIQRLKEQQAVIARNVSDIRAHYGENFPGMAKAQSDLDEVRRQLEAEIQNQVKALRGDFALRRQREADLVARLREEETALLGQNNTAIKLHELEREAQANRALYETFLAKFKQSGEQELIRQADARIIAPAEIPRGAAFPRRRLILLASFILGVLGGISLAFLLEQLDVTLRTREQVEELLGVPALALIPQLKAGLGDRAVNSYIVDKPHSSYAEALRMAWVGLQCQEGQGRVIVVTSSVPEEGKSLTSLSLARVAASMGLRAAVVDADLRRASLALKARVEPRHTIVDVIDKRVDLAAAMIRDPLSEVDLLVGRASGHKSLNLMAESERVADLFAALRERYDMIVIDSAPALASADVQVLARLADQTLFCVRWNDTSREMVISAVRALRDCRAKVAGALVTRVDVRKHAQYGYADIGYYYAKYTGA